MYQSMDDKKTAALIQSSLDALIQKQDGATDNKQEEIPLKSEETEKEQSKTSDHEPQVQLVKQTNGMMDQELELNFDAGPGQLKRLNTLQDISDYYTTKYNYKGYEIKQFVQTDTKLENVVVAVEDGAPFTGRSFRTQRALVSVEIKSDG